MAEFILKNWYGKDQVFDKETIYVQGKDGELMPFTHGDGNPVIEPLTVTQNGVYTTPVGVNGFSPVSVNVPDLPPVLQSKEATQNGEYTPDSGYDGLSKVTVNVPAPEIKLQEKTITENGEYTADSGFDGLGKVSVDVKGGGGLAPGCYWSVVDRRSSFDAIYMFQYNGKLYAYARKSSADKYGIYLVENGVYTQVATTSQTNYPYSFTEYNGKLYIGFESSNYVMDENFAFTYITSKLPKVKGCGGFVMDGKLYMKTQSSGFYKLADDGETWEAVAVANCPETPYHNMVVHNRNVYIIGQGCLYKVDWDAKVCSTIRTDLPSLASAFQTVVLGDSIYFKVYENLYKYDITTDTYQAIGIIMHNITNLYFYNNSIRLTGQASTNYFIHMELNEVTE